MPGLVNTLWFHRPDRDRDWDRDWDWVDAASWLNEKAIKVALPFNVTEKALSYWAESLPLNGWLAKMCWITAVFECHNKFQVSAKQLPTVIFSPVSILSFPSSSSFFCLPQPSSCPCRSRSIKLRLGPWPLTPRAMPAAAAAARSRSGRSALSTTLRLRKTTS